MVLHPYTAQTLTNRPAADGPAFVSAAADLATDVNNDGAPPGVPMH